MTHQRVYLSIGVLCAGSLIAATKLRDWKTGTVIDTVIEREQPNGPVAIASSGGSTTGDMALAAAMARKPVVREGLVIKGESYGLYGRLRDPLAQSQCDHPRRGQVRSRKRREVLRSGR